MPLFDTMFDNILTDMMAMRKVRGGAGGCSRTGEGGLGGLRPMSQVSYVHESSQLCTEAWSILIRPLW